MPSRVSVSTSTILSPPLSAIAAHSTYFVAGRTDRGPITPTRVTSYAELRRIYGERTTSGAIHDDLQTYFSEGGQVAYVRRVVGATPVLATITLDASGAVDALRLDAKSYGSWGNSLTATVTANSGERTITLGGTPDGVNETFTASSNADLAAAVNHAVTGSKWVTATVLNSTIIAAAAVASLSSGTEDGGTIDASAMTAALADFGPELGAGVVAIPGQGSGVQSGLLSHAGTHRRLAILCGGSTDSVSTAAAGSLALVANTYAAHGVYAYPWIKVPDGSGNVRTISPEGYVAACRARAIAQVGVWRAPFGDIADARFVVEPVTIVSSANFTTLEASRISPIVVRAGVTKLYGFRSLAALAVYRLATVRDVQNVVATNALERAELFVGAPIDAKGGLFADLAAAIRADLAPMAKAGGLYARLDPVTGQQLDPGYVVDVGSDVNTPATIAAGQVNARIGIRPAPAAEFIYIDVAAGAADAVF